MKKIGLLGVPFDGNSSYLRGSALAPPVVRAALYCDSSNMWTENGINLGANSILSDEKDLEGQDIFAEIEATVSRMLQRDLMPIVLGGDHSITYPVLKAFRKQNARIAILHFDAHPDLYENFENNPHSHASPFARIMEEKLADRLVQIGIRTLNRHQKEQAEKFSVEMFQMKDLTPQFTISFDMPVYISMDMDGLDPAFAPGVSHPEAGGLTTRQALEIIQSIDQPVIGADIVELNPQKDVAGITAMACAKILKEIAGKMLEQETIDASQTITS